MRDWEDIIKHGMAWTTVIICVLLMRSCELQEHKVDNKNIAQHLNLEK